MDTHIASQMIMNVNLTSSLDTYLIKCNLELEAGYTVCLNYSCVMYD